MSAASPAVNSFRSDATVISLVGFAHGTSHFFHFVMPPLFPWLMRDFGLTFTQVGAAMTVFFVVSGVGQALAGFVVDRVGGLRVLCGGVSGAAHGAATPAAFLRPKRRGSRGIRRRIPRIAARPAGSRGIRGNPRRGPCGRRGWDR